MKRSPGDLSRLCRPLHPPVRVVFRILLVARHGYGSALKAGDRVIQSEGRQRTADDKARRREEGRSIQNTTQGGRSATVKIFRVYFEAVLTPETASVERHRAVKDNSSRLLAGRTP